MSEIYALTSASLFGIIFRRLADKDASSTVLKSVYARIWELRNDGGSAATDPLNRLRALAHRYALDYKVKHLHDAPAAQAVPASKLKNREQLAGNHVSEKEFALLKLTYLNAVPVSVLAKTNNCSEDDMKRSIKKIVMQVRRAQS